MSIPLIPAVFSILKPPPQQESTLKLLKIVIVFGYFFITSLITISFVIISAIFTSKNYSILLNTLVETYCAIVLPSKNFFFWKVFMNNKGTKSTEKRT